MAKTVQLSEDAYKTLTAIKRPGESYSDVVRRLVRGRKDLSALLGLDPPRDDFDFDELREVSRKQDTQRLKKATGRPTASRRPRRGSKRGRRP